MPLPQDDFAGGRYSWAISLQLRPVAARAVAIGAIDVPALQILNAFRLSIIK